LDIVFAAATTRYPPRVGGVWQLDQFCRWRSVIAPCTWMLRVLPIALLYDPEQPRVAEFEIQIPETVGPAS
jgi:hypothetical protein